MAFKKQTPPDARPPEDPSFYDAPQRKPRGKGWIAALAAVIVIAALVCVTAARKSNQNVLMQAPEGITSKSMAEQNCLPVFGSGITRQEIGSITFLSSLDGAPDDAWDASADGNGSVLAWAVPNGDLYDLYIAGEGGVRAPADCTGLFAGYCNATRIDFGTGFQTENVTSMEKMFFHCYNLTKLDLRSFRTENVTNMYAMFSMCSSLTQVNVSSFDTQKVQNMSAMFNDCRNLKVLDLRSFDTSNVTQMSYMFANCPGVAVKNVSHFNTENVTDYTDFMDGVGWEQLFS